MNDGDSREGQPESPGERISSFLRHQPKATVQQIVDATGENGIVVRQFLIRDESRCLLRHLPGVMIGKVGPVAGSEVTVYSSGADKNIRGTPFKLDGVEARYGEVRGPSEILLTFSAPMIADRFRSLRGREVIFESTDTDGMIPLPPIT